jgi:hypothetical protein
MCDRDKNLADQEVGVRMYMYSTHNVLCRLADFRCSQRCCKVSSHLRSDAVTTDKHVPTFRSNHYRFRLSDGEEQHNVTLPDVRNTT